MLIAAQEDSGQTRLPMYRNLAAILVAAQVYLDFAFLVEASDVAAAFNPASQGGLDNFLVCLGRDEPGTPARG